MNVEISAAAKRIIALLEGAGFCAYITGGAVRDLVMGIAPHDFDISTSAKPHQIKTLFPRTINTGIRYGSVTVVEGGQGYEISTFRKNPKNEAPSFSDDIQEDLSYRDFTMNALAYNPERGIYDFFGGTEDIKNRVIRCVGDAEQRFSEDPVRMLRAVRFSAALDFCIESESMRAIRKYGVMIKKSSPDRIREELNKILLSDRPERIELLRSTGLMRHIMPELDTCFSVEQKNKYHMYDVGTHIIKALASTPRDIVLRWAALFHDIGKPCCKSIDNSGIIHFYGHHRESVRIANDIMHRLHFDPALIHDICVLVENHDVRIEPSPPAVKHMLARTGSELFEKLLTLQEADNRGKHPKYLDEKLKRTELVRSIYRRIIEENQPFKISDLVVNSRDLIKLGFRAGREIGDTLRILLDEVLIDPSLNNREYLLKRVKQIKNKRGKHH